MVYIGPVTNILIKSQRNRKRVTSLDGVKKKKKVPYCEREAGPPACDGVCPLHLVTQQSSAGIGIAALKMGQARHGWQSTLADKPKRDLDILT